ncbi:traB domain-containing protein isoform X1 [Apis laboriosa]|uniref:traB domain-containing protein isoform X1 n=1 Tax=Apis laboriosa TaxID=183418 RepID=UPI001CC4535B|nr:traB domain-containing protein isoform X1 [Apis laboriosa]XP_043796675.1 traB domain-containing protein isoform X1 [Apis laboriosa]
MSSHIMSADCSKNKYSIIAKQYCVIDTKDTIDDKSSYIQSSSEKLISSELQIDLQSVNKSKYESDTIQFLIDTKKEKTKEVIGHQLRFSAHNENSNKDINIAASIQPEYDASIDEKLPETVKLLTTPEGGKLYLVGTAHFSIESQNDVATIIQAVQPHIVVVELCKARIGAININEETLYRDATDLSLKNLTEILRHHGAYNGLLHIMLYSILAHIVKQLGMAPGGEFRTAFKEAKKVPNCIIQLADRSIDVTIQRALREVSWWEIIKLTWFVLRLDSRISKQDIERYKRKCVLEQMISTLREEYPAIEKTFVTERDIYLTYHLQMATATQYTSAGLISPRVVGVVGIGHINGIVENWGKVKASDIWPIIRVPPQSLSTKILKFTIKASLLGATIYVGYKVIPLPSINVLQSIRSSIEGLLKGSAK